MYHNLTYRDASHALPYLLERIDQHGEEVGSRNGGCREITHVGITLTEPWRRELLVPERKPNLAAQIAETMWVLGGRDDMEFLSHYLPRAKDFSDDGVTWRAGYGARLRSWEDHGHAVRTDQFAECYRLLKEDLTTRRAVMSIWDPALDYAESKDIPCNNWLSWSCRNGKLDLMVAIRSNDVIWGWSGINAYEWSAMQEVMAGLLQVEVGGLHFATTSLHLYQTHWAKSTRIQHEADNVPEDPLLTDLRFEPEWDHNYATHLEWFQQCLADWFALEYDIRTGSPLVDGYIDRFPEPMLRGWLRVLQWWWSGGDKSYLESIDETRLALATEYSVQPKQNDVVHLHVESQADPVASYRIPVVPSPSDFLDGLCRLHLQKEQAYGGSWKKRGELFSILPNVGRKVDRLNQHGETEDETLADTAGDLFVYLAKYKTWLDEFVTGGEPLFDGLSDSAHNANQVMLEVEQSLARPSLLEDLDTWEAYLIMAYENLLTLAEAKDPSRVQVVDQMLPVAYRLARSLWERSEGLDEYRGADVD